MALSVRAVRTVSPPGANSEFARRELFDVSEAFETYVGRKTTNNSGNVKEKWGKFGCFIHFS